ncbi:2,3-bisphosphoglycerate-dependent phosphoglycerate mutase [Pelagibius marinus]|uniref:2,3-bisphosphoglycerate-dependent phosphoglycerate mutase n=1 Tax=Pelagibius marinus TaxID=2762760 RepID=UPI0029CA50BE|nr:2,3-bisphosphoglycerate-dependent phosphoglycerate mutase [Pelagibius marinus]
MRHGKTEWSSQNRFAGWADAPLSAAGVQEAHGAGRSLAATGLEFDLYCTSYLSRAVKTLEIILEELDQPEAQIERSWRLNERHYGALQGFNRAKMALQHGNDQVAAWRRSFTAEPPPLPDGDPRLPALDPLYAGIDPALLPRSESLEQAAARVAPWWRDFLAPRLSQGRNALVVAHTSSIRGLVREIEGLSGEEAAEFRIATALPVIYTLDTELKVTDKQELIAGWSSRLRKFINRHKPGTRISWI